MICSLAPISHNIKAACMCSQNSSDRRTRGLRTLALDSLGPLGWGVGASMHWAGSDDQTGMWAVELKASGSLLVPRVVPEQFLGGGGAQRPAG